MFYHMRWREDFEDQEGTFPDKVSLNKEIDRLMKLKDEEDDDTWTGEFDPEEIKIIEGRDATYEFMRYRL